MELVWGGVKGAGVLDYVTCWYVKAARYITGAAPSAIGNAPSFATAAGATSPEGSRKLAGGASHRNTHENASAPAGAAESRWHTEGPVCRSATAAMGQTGVSMRHTGDAVA